MSAKLSFKMNQRKRGTGKMARKQMYNSKKKNWQQIDEEINSLRERATEVIHSMWGGLMVVYIHEGINE